MTGIGTSDDPKVPAELVSACARVMAFASEDRFQSAAALAAEAQAWWTAHS